MRTVASPALVLVILAKAGIHFDSALEFVTPPKIKMGSRLRGNDEVGEH